MSHARRADWCANVPWSGVLDKPAGLGGPTDIGQLTAAGFSAGQIPIWNGSKFIPGSNGGGGGSSGIEELDRPAVATKRYVFDTGTYQNVWLQEIFDVIQYGADPTASADATQAFNNAINDLNSAGRGCLVIPSGRYVLGGTLSPIGAPCMIRGEGIGASVLIVNDNGFGFFNSQFCGAQGFEIFGGASTGYGINITDGTAGFEEPWFISEVKITGFGYGAIVSTARKGWLLNSHFEATTLGLDLTIDNSFIRGVSISNGGNNTRNALELIGNNNQLSSLKIIGLTNRFSQAIVLQSGDFNTISDSFIYGCENEAISLTDGTASAGPTRVQNITFGDIQGSTPVTFDPTIHYVNELMGVGGNADASYDSRKELAASETWDPGSIADGANESNDFTVTGASPGDQAIYGAPYDLQGLNVAICIPSVDTVRVTISNNTGAPVDLGSGIWSVRVLN